MLRQATRKGDVREVDRVLLKEWDKEKDDINDTDEVFEMYRTLIL